MSETKLCVRCNEVKPRSAFGPAKRMASGLKSWCRPCYSIAAQGYYRKDIEKSRANRREQVKKHYTKERGRRQHLRDIYNLTTEQYQELLSSQGHACAICRSEKPGGKGDWHVDHDHSTGAVRGILCAGCNVGIGHFKEDADRLMKAVAYLNTHKETS